MSGAHLSRHQYVNNAQPLTDASDIGWAPLQAQGCAQSEGWGDSPKITNWPPDFVKSGGRDLPPLSPYLTKSYIAFFIECPLFSGQSPFFLDIEGDLPS